MMVLIPKQYLQRAGISLVTRSSISCKPRLEQLMSEVDLVVFLQGDGSLLRVSNMFIQDSILLSWVSGLER